MTDTTRNLIQRLADALTNAIQVIHNEDGTQHISTATPVLNEARAYLAQPEPKGLTDEEIEILADDYMFMDGADGTMHLQHIDFAHAAIAADRARWGRPAVEPPCKPAHDTAHDSSQRP